MVPVADSGMPDPTKRILGQLVVGRSSGSIHAYKLSRTVVNVVSGGHNIDILVTNRTNLYHLHLKLGIYTIRGNANDNCIRGYRLSPDTSDSMSGPSLTVITLGLTVLDGCICYMIHTCSLRIRPTGSDVFG